MFIKNLILILCLALMSVQSISAQNTAKKVYDENINQLEQIDKAVAQAKASNRYVICQLGGNWCPWCLRFADFIQQDSTINQLIKDNYIYIHVNYPGRSAHLDAAKKALVDKTMARLDNAGRFGYPVLVVLDEEGKVIHIQDSSYLEEGQGYNQAKVVRFLKGWAPAAVKGE